MADTTQLQGFVVDPALALSTTNENVAVTLNKRRGLRTGQTQANLQDAVERGNVWSVASQAGVTTQAGLSATTPVLTIYNPLGSNVNGVLWYAAANFTVIFGAVAAVWVAAGTNASAAAVTGTPTTAHRNLKFGSGTNPKALQFLLAATLPAAPVGIHLLGVGLTGAVNLLPTGQNMCEWFNGSIIIAPGCNLSIQTSAASGTSGMWNSYIIEEVTI